MSAVKRHADDLGSGRVSIDDGVAQESQAHHEEQADEQWVNLVASAGVAESVEGVELNEESVSSAESARRSAATFSHETTHVGACK